MTLSAQNSPYSAFKNYVAVLKSKLIRKFKMLRVANMKN